MNLFFSRKLIRVFFIAYSLLIATSLTSVFASPEAVATYQAKNSAVVPTFQPTLTGQSATAIKIQWTPITNIKSYTILRRYELATQTTGTDIDQTSGMNIIKVITEPSYYYYTDETVDQNQANVYYQIKAEYNGDTPKIEYSTIAFLENRFGVTSNTSLGQPYCTADGACNAAALAEAVEEGGGSFDWDSIKNNIFDFFSSSGSSTNYKPEDEIPNVDAVNKMVEGFDLLGSKGAISADKAKEYAKRIFDKCSSDGSCTAGEVAKDFPMDLDRYKALEDNRANITLIEDSKKRKALMDSDADEISVLGGSTGGIVGATGGTGEGSGSGQASEDAASSAKYVLDNFSGISAVNIDVFQCQSNTGIFCIIETVIKLALTLAGLIAVAFIVYGGYLYITSAGNPEGAKAGTTAVTNAAIGLIIILAAWLIVATVLNVIGTGKV